jgi:hypothetical protein
MTTTTNSGNTNSGSATIYTFPPRGRFALRIDDRNSTAAANVPLPRGVKLVSGGSSWYHDEAVQDAIANEPGSKN